MYYTFYEIISIAKKILIVSGPNSYELTKSDKHPTWRRLLLKVLSTLNLCNEVTEILKFLENLQNMSWDIINLLRRY